MALLKGRTGVHPDCYVAGNRFNWRGFVRTVCRLLVAVAVLASPLADPTAAIATDPSFEEALANGIRMRSELGFDASRETVSGLCA